ncbi:MAG: type I glutamate--ammonia ligase [Clostridia bacterium]|nr:type I glutamate--ammonia ligase [Clostridia bacterium]
MPNYTRSDILSMAREQNVQFIRLQFTDMLGCVKNVEIPATQLERAIDRGAMFDGSSIEGFARIHESDMNLRPDLSTFAIYPWKHGERAIARLICDVCNNDGAPFEGDPRRILHRAVADAASMGYEVMVGPECEFFLFTQDQAGLPTVHTGDQAGYFDLYPRDHGEDARRDIVLALEDMGFRVEAAHHELAPGQHEIDFEYSDAMTAADNVTTLKFITKVVARNHGLHATFMPKPITGIAGSGMHVNLSLFSQGANAFFDQSALHGLSDTALFFIEGLLSHSKALAAVTNPTVNSYKRLVPGYEAPVYVCWSEGNRTSLCRVPSSRGANTRVELRSPDSSCNPYMAFAAIIASGLDGVRKQTPPPSPVRKNTYRMSPDERAQDGIASLPGSLSEALDWLAKDQILVSAIGEPLYHRFVKARRLEWEGYQTNVHPWELDRYLTTL